MPTFQYIAMDPQGTEKRGTIEASNETAALARIREQGLFPTKVAKAGKGRKGKAKKSGKKDALQIELKLPSFMYSVKAKTLMIFTRQFATLVNAGLPLLRGIQVLQRQEKNPALKKALSEMGDAIQGGGTLAEAMGQHSKIFNRLYVNMVKAGELGGVLDQVLLRLSEFMEKAEKIKGKVMSAMIYPIVVLIMAVLILIFLMVFIIPKFEEIFSELLGGAQLPALTQFVLNISETVQTKGLYVLGGVIALVVVSKLLAAGRFGRVFLDRIKLNVPIFGTLLRKTAIARFSRTLGTLMTAGVPVLQALNIVRDTSGNEVIAKAVNEVHDAVKEGENMAPPIEQCGVFPPIVVSMVEVGEETGALPEMLMKIADSYDEEVDNTVAGLTSIIEPLLIVFLALIVGTIVIALFLPLIQIIGKLGS